MGWNDKFMRQIGLGVIIVSILGIIGVLIFSLLGIGNDYFVNLYTGFIEIFITIFIIDILNKRLSENQYKDQLILQMASPSNDFAIEAVRILKQKGWLYDGSLTGIDFSGANLQNAELQRAQLQECKFDNASLQGVDLEGANLNNAYLLSANLRNANLVEANLSGANLVKADLYNAKLVRTNDSTYQHMLYFTYHDAKFSEETILPDGTTWTPRKELDDIIRLE